jgi:hypothetical protein
MLPVLISVKSKPQGLVRPEGLGKFKNSPHRIFQNKPNYIFSPPLNFVYGFQVITLTSLLYS